MSENNPPREEIKREPPTVEGLRESLKRATENGFIKEPNSTTQEAVTTNQTNNLKIEDIIPKSNWTENATKQSNPEDSTNPPSLDPLNQPSKATEVLAKLEADRIAQQKYHEENPLTKNPPFVDRMVERRNTTENTLTPRQEGDILVNDAIENAKKKQMEGRIVQIDNNLQFKQEPVAQQPVTTLRSAEEITMNGSFLEKRKSFESSNGVLLKDESTAEEQKSQSPEDLLEQVKENLAQIDNIPESKVEPKLKSALDIANNGAFPQKRPSQEFPNGVLIGNQVPEAEVKSADSNRELVEAVTKLIKTLEELRTSYTSDPQLQLTIKNLMIGLGNIVNAEGESSITIGDDSVKNEINLGGEEQITSIEEIIEQENSKETTKVDDLEELQKQKAELEKKLEDLSLLDEEKEKIKKAIDELNDVIKKAEGVVEKEQEEAADDITKLSEEEKKEFSDAGKTKEGFSATITRMFKGKKWKAFLANAGISTASTLAVGKIAAVTIASLGPVGIGIVGGVLVGMGGLAAFKTLKNVKNTAEAQGVSVKELLSDKKFRGGALLGGLISGSTRIGLPSFIPGVGPMLPFLGMAIELGVSGIGERNLNKQQEELVTKYLSTFELRRYKKLKEQGYLAREGVNINKIVEDMSDQNITEDERKTAKKAAIASLLYLYNETKDEKYKILHYTVKEDGKDVRKELDITTFEVKETDDNTDQYPKLQLTGNFESYVDLLDIDELSRLTLEASGHASLEDRKGLTNELVSLFVGIEATDVDNLLSKEREQYFQSVAFLTGFRTGSGVVNSLIIMGSGATLVGQAVEAHNQISADRSVQREYRESLGDDDANVDSYTRADGTKVNTIDLDHDGTPDLIHDTRTGEYSANTVSGAEKLFEIQNTEIGNVTTSEFSASSTGITGTFVNDSGQVVGVMYNDPSGNIGVMSTGQLAQSLQATYTNNSPASFNISNLQSNGDMILNIGNQQYTTNLSTLEGVGGTEAILSVDPLAGSVAPGDSVPSVLTKIMQQVKADNPNLAKYDDYELQRSLYQGDRLGNDSAIRSEFGFTNPVQPNQEFNVRNSPTILGWLEGLNGGPVTLPEVGSSTVGSDGVSFAFNRPMLNPISLDGLTPFEVDVPVEIDTNITSTHLAALVAAGLGAFAPKQVGGITRSTTIELFGGDSETPDPTPPLPPPPMPTPEQEKEYIRQILRTQVLTFTWDKKLKATTGSNFNIGGKQLVATDHGWMFDNDLIERGDKEGIERIINVFLAKDKGEQAKILTEIIGKLTPERRITMSKDGQVFRKQKDGSWIELNILENGKENIEGEKREVISSSQLADRILLIERDTEGKIVGSRVLPGTQRTNTQSTSTDSSSKTVKTSSTSETVKEKSTIETPGIKAEAKVETTSEQGENNEMKERAYFDGAMGDIVGKLRERKLPLTINNKDYKYNPSTGIWKADDGIEIHKDHLYDRVSTEYANNKEMLVEDIETMLSRLTHYGNEHGIKSDKIRVGTTEYRREQGIDTLIWKEVNKENSENKKIYDQELANKIVNIEKTAEAQTGVEQADKAPESKETEKPEKKGRKLLRLALLATGIGGGVLASSLTGMPVAVALSAAVVSVGSRIVRSVAGAREKSLRRESEEMKRSIRERDDKRFTDEEVGKDRQFEKKMKRASNIVEICKDIAWLTNPMAITSLAYGILSPNISEVGMQIDIKAWLEGTMRKIKNIDINVETAKEAFNLGSK